MGVRGLMSFVEHNHNAFYAQERLCDCNLVIDGFGLVYALYFDEGRDGSLNGEFLDLYRNIENFFACLAECNISPFVIFDGPIEQEKLSCVVGRLNERIQDVHKVLTGRSSGGRLLPMFAVDALHHYLKSNGIPMAITLVDADDEVVAVANHFNCPVLSQDSDYYIYNVRGGYLPFTHFDWKQVRVDRRTRRKAIFCEKYHISFMFNQFGVYNHLLPFLSVLIGNDWIGPSVFQELVSSFPSMRSNSHNKGKKPKSCDQKMLSVLNWLSLKSGNDEAVFNTLFGHLRRTRQGHLMRNVENCVAMYREPTDIAETLKTLGIWRKSANDYNRDPYQIIQDIVRNCRAHPFVLNVLESAYVCLPVVMSDTQKSSPHDAASDVRCLTYRVLLRQYRFPLAGPELLRIQEYDKIRLTYAKSQPKSFLTSQCVMCEQRHALEQPCVVDGRKKFAARATTMDILRKISPEISSFCDFAKKSHADEVPQNLKIYLDLVMTSTMLWIHKTSPDPLKKCAILATLAWSFCNSRNSLPIQMRSGESQSRRGRCQSGRGRHQSRHGSSHSQPLDDYDARVEQFLNFINSRMVTSASGRNEVIERDLDVTFLHSVAQWLCILNATVILHQVIENPSTKFSIHYFVTSSSLLHEVHFRLTLLPRNSVKEGFASLSRIVSDRLNSMPDIKNIFEIFAAFLVS